MNEELPPAGSPEATSESGAETPGGAPPSNPSSRFVAAFSYVFGPFALIALFLPSFRSEDFVRFHSAQAVMLWGIALVGSAIPCIGPLVVFVVLVAGLLAAFGALTGDYSQIPFVSGFVSRFIWP